MSPFSRLLIWNSDITIICHFCSGFQNVAENRVPTIYAVARYQFPQPRDKFPSALLPLQGLPSLGDISAYLSPLTLPHQLLALLLHFFLNFRDMCSYTIGEDGPGHLIVCLLFTGFFLNNQKSTRAQVSAKFYRNVTQDIRKALQQQMKRCQS